MRRVGGRTGVVVVYGGATAGRVQVGVVYVAVVYGGWEVPVT